MHSPEFPASKSPNLSEVAIQHNALDPPACEGLQLEDH